MRDSEWTLRQLKVPPLHPRGMSLEKLCGIKVYKLEYQAERSAFYWLRDLQCTPKPLCVLVFFASVKS